MNEKALTEETKGYCPKCGCWAINTGVDHNGERVDECNVCGTVYAASKLEFIDSRECECGHPRSWHDRSTRSCEIGNMKVGCDCQKYRPTSVNIVSL